MRYNYLQDLDQPEFADGSLIGVLLRHKKKIVLLPLVSIALGALIILYFPRGYGSEAKLFLQVGRESVGLDPTATTGQTINLTQSGREDEMKSAIELMTSRGVIAKVVERLTPALVLEGAETGGAKPNPVAETINQIVGTAIGWVKSLDPISPAEEACIVIERHLEAKAERGSTIIVVRYETSTPELAQRILNEVLETYQQEHVRIHRNQGSLEFFVQQCDELRALLDKKAQELRDKRNELGLSSVDGRRQSLEQQLHGVELAMYQTKQDLSSADAHVQGLRQELREIPARTLSQRIMTPNTGADLMRQQLYALKVREKEYQSRYNEEHPDLVAIRLQVAEAQAVVDQEKEVREETTDDINIVHQQLTLELRQEVARTEGLKSRLAEINEQRKSVHNALKQLNADEVAVAELEREESIVRANFMQYTENLEQSRIDQQREANRVSNISMAQVPTLARKPVTPSKMLVGLASLVLATAGTGALVLASEQLHGHRNVHPGNVNGAAKRLDAPSSRRRVHHRELAVKTNDHA